MRSFSVVAGGASFFASALSLKGVDGTEPPIYYALTAPFFYFAFAPQRFFHSLTAREKKRLGSGSRFQILFDFHCVALFAPE